MRKPIVPRSITAVAFAGLLAGITACGGNVGGSYLPPADRAPESARALPGPSATPTPEPGPLPTLPPPHHHILSARALPGPSATPTPAPGATKTPAPHRIL